MKKSILMLGVLVWALAVVACDRETSTPPPEAAGGGSVVSHGGAGGMSPATGGGGGQEPEEGCSGAPFLTFSENGNLSAFDVTFGKSESVYFRFVLDQAGWYEALTQGDGATDTVVMLRDESGNLLAVNDDSPERSLGFEADASLTYRFAEAGTYCVQVTDYETFTGDASSQGSLMPFVVGVVALEKFDGVYFDEGDNDTVATAQAVTNHAYVVGTHSGPDDVDIFHFEIPNTTGQWIGLSMNPAGPGANTWFTGSGSVAQSVISVLASDGTTVLAQANYEELSESCNPVLTICGFILDAKGGTDFYVRVEGPEGMPGPGAWYTFVVGTVGVYQVVEPPGDELDDVNDTPLTAVHVPDKRLLGEVPDGDVDWWRIGDMTDPSITSVGVACRSRGEGGGLIDLEVAAFLAESGGTGAPIASFVETPREFLRWGEGPGAQRPPLPGGAEYLLRVTAAGALSGLANATYSCDVTPSRTDN